MKKYTAYFEAESQQALYDMMVESVGQAAQGRILQRAAEPVAPTVVRHDGANLPPMVAGSITVSSDSAAPKKRGRKPGQKVGPYKKDAKDETKSSEEAQADEEASPETQDDGEGDSGVPAPAHAPVVGSSQAAQAPSQAPKVATIEDAVTALKLVNSKKNVDAARAALEHFGVRRCGELTDANRGLFVAHCEKVAAS